MIEDTELDGRSFISKLVLIMVNIYVHAIKELLT